MIYRLCVFVQLEFLEADTQESSDTKNVNDKITGTIVLV